MRLVLGTLCVGLLIFPDPTELAGRHKDDAVHPFPIEINVHHIESMITKGRVFDLEAGLYCVGTDEKGEYIIGKITGEHLFPLMARRKDLNDNYGRVKLRINGNDAKEIVPISNEDPLNDRFFKEFGTHNIRPAWICVAK